jgi:hypothetical protein
MIILPANSKNFLVSTDTGIEFLSKYTQTLKGYMDKIKLILIEKDHTLKLNEKLIPTKTLEKKLQKNLYINIMDLPIFIPPGLNIKAIDYSNVLEEAVEINIKLIPNILNPLQRYLSIILTDINLLNQKTLHTSLKDFQSNDTVTMNKKIGRSFITGSTQVTKPLKDVYSNFNEMKLTFQKVEEISAKYNSISYDGVKKTINTTNHYLKVIINELENYEGKDLIEVNKLNQYVFTAALEIEFYGVMGYYLTSFITSLNRTYEKL